MLSRRKFLTALGALGLPIGLCTCDQGAAPLRIATHVWPGYEFMFLAQREGLISGEDCELIETGSATESLARLAAGEVDGAALTLDEMLGARAGGLPLVAVLIFDISLGADVLLSKPAIESLPALKGMRIGYEPSAVGALMLHKALDAAGLGIGEVQPVQLTFDRHADAWAADTVDALISFEPVVRHLESGGARRLFDSSRIPDTIFDVLAVMPQALERKSDALKRLIAAHFQVLRDFRKNPNDIAYRMAERFRLPAKEVIAAYGGLELPNIYRNRKLLRGPLADTAEALSRFLLQNGIMKDAPTDFSGLTDAGLLPREDDL